MCLGTRLCRELVLWDGACPVARTVRTLDVVVVGAVDLMAVTFVVLAVLDMI